MVSIAGGTGTRHFFRGVAGRTHLFVMRLKIAAIPFNNRRLKSMTSCTFGTFSHVTDMKFVTEFSEAI
jgi:hypothetical protein